MSFPHYIFVIPAEAGIHNVSKRLDSRLRGNDARGAGMTT